MALPCEPVNSGIGMGNGDESQQVEGTDVENSSGEIPHWMPPEGPNPSALSIIESARTTTPYLILNALDQQSAFIDIHFNVLKCGFL